MPKCYECGKEQKVLSSIIMPGQMMGFALCDSCRQKAEKATTLFKKAMK